MILTFYTIATGLWHETHTGRNLDLDWGIFPSSRSVRKLGRPSTGVIRGLGPRWANVASCWRRASSTIACSFRFLKKSGTQRRKIFASLS